MPKKFIQKISFIMLTLSLLLTNIPISSTYAASGYVNIMHKISTATANTPINYNFSLSRKSDIYFIITESERVGATIIIKEPIHDTPLETIYLPSSNPKWKYNQSSGIYKNTTNAKLDAGDYILELRFDQDVNFDLSMNQISETATLNKSKTTITEGFSETLKVNGGKIKSCSSNNTAIAAVTNKGKITAKKMGKATIKVKLTDGKTLSCKVTVAENQYAAKKIDVEGTQFNTCAMKAYSATFDKKGNLVVKFKIVNNSYGQITKIPNFKITVKNSNKKVIGNYKTSSYKVTIPSYKDKSCTVTIPKAKLAMRQNKIDLRTSKFSITGDFADASL